MDNLRYLSQGETGLVVEFGETIDPFINTRVHALARTIASEYKQLV